MDPSQRKKKSLRCGYHIDHRLETDKCRSQKFLVEKLIKVGHLRRYVKEVDHGDEIGKVTDKITVGVVIPSESRPAINYILGGQSDDQYLSKR